MCDWEWDDIAKAGLLGEMLADEEIEKILAERQNEPMTLDEMLEDNDWLDEEDI